MNGLQLIEQVHASEPGMPVLVTTGYLDELPARAMREKSWLCQHTLLITPIAIRSNCSAEVTRPPSSARRQPK
ncbi:MAG: hypothetical protein AB1437_25085 [Pseudomonadota bacterium]